MEHNIFWRNANCYCSNKRVSDGVDYSNTTTVHIKNIDPITSSVYNHSSWCPTNAYCSNNIGSGGMYYANGPIIVIISNIDLTTSRINSKIDRCTTNSYGINNRISGCIYYAHAAICIISNIGPITSSIKHNFSGIFTSRNIYSRYGRNYSYDRT